MVWNSDFESVVDTELYRDTWSETNVYDILCWATTLAIMGTDLIRWTEESSV